MKLDPYFGVGWVRLWDAASALDRREEVEEAVRQIRAINPAIGRVSSGYSITRSPMDATEEARAALAEIEKSLPGKDAALRRLLPWALGEPGIDRARAARGDRECAGERSQRFLDRAPGHRRLQRRHRDVAERYLEAYYFANLYSSKPAGHAMLRDPRVKAKLVRYGFPAYWREKGWPAGCRPIGERISSAAPTAQQFQHSHRPEHAAKTPPK